MRYLTIAIFALLTGCASVESVKNYSNYDVCRLSYRRPLLQPNSAIVEADRQVGIRGIDCSPYIATFSNQDAVYLQMLGMGLNQMSQPYQQPAPSTFQNYNIKGNQYNCMTTGTITTCQ
jgi:hypothetical protein